MGLSPFGDMGDAMFSIVPVIVMIGFVFVFGTIIVRSIQGVGQWRRNNASPILTVDAKVSSKRIDVSHHHHHDAGTSHMHHTSHTTYYVTFEVQSGDRMEFVVPGREYGKLSEQDYGKLTFQGTRYLNFERSARV